MSTSTLLNMTRDINGYNAFGLQFAKDSYQTTLSASAAQSLTVPSNFAVWTAVFAYTPGAEVWVADNTTATLPSGSFSSTASQMNPTVRQVLAGDVLSFITSNATADVGVSLYALG